MQGECKLCGRIAELEKHHLFPVKTRREDASFILVCHQCGDAVHQQITNQELQSYYHTVERLKARLQKYIEWVKNKPVSQHFTVAQKKRKLR